MWEQVWSTTSWYRAFFAIHAWVCHWFFHGCCISGLHVSTFFCFLSLPCPSFPVFPCQMELAEGKAAEFEEMPPKADGCPLRHGHEKVAIRLLYGSSWSSPRTDWNAAFLLYTACLRHILVKPYNWFEPSISAVYILYTAHLGQALELIWKQHVCCIHLVYGSPWSSPRTYLKAACLLHTASIRLILVKP